MTVYEDIMSMKGFIDYSNNGSDDTTSCCPSPSSKETNKSFQGITGIHSKLHAIDRLDVDTSGLLLLTNDGGLIHHVTNPTASTSASTKVPQLMDTTRSKRRNNEKKNNDNARSRSNDDDTNCNTIEGVQVLKTYEAVIMGYHSLPQHDDKHTGKNQNHNNSVKPPLEDKLLRLYKGVDIGAT